MSALPQALRLLTGAPWWVYGVVVFACLVAYICRLFVIYKISLKALEKVSATGAPQIVNAVTGYKARVPGARRKSDGSPPPGGP